MAVSEFILDEMFEDMEKITVLLEQFADRWSEYGDRLQHKMTPEQRERFERRMRGMLDRLEKFSD